MRRAWRYRRSRREREKQTHPAKMADCDAQWDEDRGATRPAQPDNILPDQWRPPQNNGVGDDHSVFQWEVCGGHDNGMDNGRHVTPSIYIEKLLRAAPVKDPASFSLAAPSTLYQSALTLHTWRQPLNLELAHRRGPSGRGGCARQRSKATLRRQRRAIYTRTPTSW